MFRSVAAIPRFDITLVHQFLDDPSRTLGIQLQTGDLPANVKQQIRRSSFEGMDGRMVSKRMFRRHISKGWMKAISPLVFPASQQGGSGDSIRVTHEKMRAHPPQSYGRSCLADGRHLKQEFVIDQVSMSG